MGGIQGVDVCTYGGLKPSSTLYTVYIYISNAVKAIFEEALNSEREGALQKGASSRVYLVISATVLLGSK